MPPRFLLTLLFCAATHLSAETVTFVWPTPNDWLGKATPHLFYVGTAGKSWESGMFGCVRTEGRQMHEGLDIRCTQRDKDGEPRDPVFAAAPGKVAYLNRQAGLSTYGRYIMLEHSIEGLQVFTIYAHLNRFTEGLKIGDPVKQGQAIAVMGRTSNTRQSISRDRAHLHFEICFRLNDRFAAWHSENLKGQRNDHGNFNGRNFVAIDPAPHFMKDAGQFLDSIRRGTELCRVQVRTTKFPWLRHCTPLVRRNPVADRDGVAGYEVALDFNGVPFQLIPRSASEMRKGPRVQLLSVNEGEQQAHPCRKLVVKRGGKWVLSTAGEQLIDLLIY